jgi:hypothetical protein
MNAAITRDFLFSVCLSLSLIARESKQKQQTSTMGKLEQENDRRRAGGRAFVLLLFSLHPSPYRNEAHFGQIASFLVFSVARSLLSIV